jgi:hypothetical protein
MDLKAQIDDLASRFAHNSVKGGSGVNMNFVKRANGQRVWAYMRRWLDEHRELPTGEHLIPEYCRYDVLGDPPMARWGPALAVDFTKLQHDPEYPLRGRDNIYS